MMPCTRSLCAAAVILFSCASFAQITITSQDIPAIGETLWYQSVPGIVAVDVGSAGADQVWTLPDYDWDAPYPVDVVDPAATPYTADFPGANRCLYGFNDDLGVEGMAYFYQRIGTNGCYNLGMVVEADTFVQSFQFTDEALFAPLPATYGAEWTTVMRYTIEWNELTATRVDSVLNEIDAWGNVQTDAGDFEALRVFERRWSILRLPFPFPEQVTRNVSYTWYSADGVAGLRMESVIDVTDPDFSQGTVSAVQVGTEALSPVRGPVAGSFRVAQNYPNPFNPTTSLPISLAQSAQVEVVVYNELGEVVSSQEYSFSPGEHTVGFDGSAWASGNYFAQVKAGGIAQTKRMTLVK